MEEAEEQEETVEQEENAAQEDSVKTETLKPAEPMHSMDEVRKQLAEKGLEERGSDFVLRSRLYLHEKRATRVSPTELQYLLVVDFEATCETDKPPGSYEQEIIEFPAVLVDARTKTIVGEFHSYCRPTGSPISPFCTELTGITQEMVDAAETFPEVLVRFDEFLDGFGLFTNPNWCIVTDGSFDLALFLALQCKMCRLPVPAYGRMFVHLPKLFQWVYLSSDPTKHRANMKEMLAHFEMELEGRHHSGIDDARNLAKIVIQMLNDQVRFRPTDITLVGEKDEKKPLCVKVIPVHKAKWNGVHKSLMKKNVKRRQELQEH